MESTGSPGPPDSAVPSDTDLGVPCLPQIGFVPREDSEDRVNGDGAAGVASVQAQTQPQPGQSNQASSSTGGGCQRRTDLLLLLNYNDQHSSEEELEVINSPRTTASQSCRPATAPEKRKWSQVSSGSNHARSPSQSQHQLHHSQTSTSVGGATCSAPASRAGREPAGSGSSDEEVSVIAVLF